MLGSAEERFRAITAVTPVGVFLSDANGQCEYVNDRWCELAGLTAEEAMGDGWFASLHPDDRERATAEWATAAEAGADSVIEYRFLRPDGSSRWIEGFASALHDESGLVVGWVGTCLDLTARKETEEELQRSAERFRVAFDDAPIGVALLTPDGRWFHVNRALCELLGYSADELNERTFAELTHPDDRAANLERNRLQREGGAWEKRIEKRYIRSDGEVVWVALSNELVRDDAGELLYFVAHVEDITQSRLTANALSEAEERFRRAFEDAPIGMALVAPDGGFLRVNGAFCDITGYDEAELLSLGFQQITHSDDVEADLGHVQQLLQGNVRSFKSEKRFVRSDGAVVWVLLSVSLVRDPDGEPLHFVGHIEDITGRKQAERELQRLADHDPLTGLLNRRRFHEELQRELERMTRRPGRIALLFLDIDNFKLVNDGYGHTAGDDVLRAVALTLTSTIRASDVAARLGGDEFAILLTELSGPDDAQTVAAHIVEAIRSQTVLSRGGAISLTVSIGLVTLDESDVGREEDALITADRALYRAKHNGRDQVVISAA